MVTTIFSKKRLLRNGQFFWNGSLYLRYCKNVDYDSEQDRKNSNFIGAVKAASILIWPVFKTRPFLFIALQLVSFSGAQYFRLAETAMNGQMKENIPMLAANAGLSISFDLIWHAVFFMVSIVATLQVASGHSVLPKQASGPAFNELLIENTRVLSRVIFWLPFLVLPAVYNYIRLSMVSFVVLIDRDYETGQVDAMERSREITRGHLPLCLLALVIAGALEPLASSVITGGENSVTINPIGALVSIPVSLALQLWAMIFLFAIYARLAKLQIRL